MQVYSYYQAVRIQLIKLQHELINKNKLVPWLCYIHFHYYSFSISGVMLHPFPRLRFLQFKGYVTPTYNYIHCYNYICYTIPISNVMPHPFPRLYNTQFHYHTTPSSLTIFYPFSLYFCQFPWFCYTKYRKYPACILKMKRNSSLFIIK